MIKASCEARKAFMHKTESLTRILQSSGDAAEKYWICKILLLISMTIRNMTQIPNNHYKNSPLVLYLSKASNNFDDALLFN